MAFALLSHVVADLALGKPALPWLSSSACVRDAIAALKQISDDAPEISVWDCSSTAISAHQNCNCIGKICMQKVICYLASEKCLHDLEQALDAPLTDLLGQSKCEVQHIDPGASLLEALELLIGGVHNLVVPITGRKFSVNDRHVKTCMSVKTRSCTLAASLSLPKDHDGQEYCWLTQEDVLRFLLGSISTFSPLPMMSVEALGLIRSDVRMVRVEQEASSAFEWIKEACDDESAVAIVDSYDGMAWAFHLVGDFSRPTLQTCNEIVALALMTLSAGDFLDFMQDCTNPPQVLLDMIRTQAQDKLGLAKLPNRHLSDRKEDTKSLLQKLEEWEESSSEDEGSGPDSPSGPHDLSRKWHSAHFRSSRKGLMPKNRSGPIFCNPKSSLIAVVLQALAHREHYVWVTEDDQCLMGIVTLKDILRIMLNHINIFS